MLETRDAVAFKMVRSNLRKGTNIVQENSWEVMRKSNKVLVENSEQNIASCHEGIHYQGRGWSKTRCKVSRFD